MNKSLLVCSLADSGLVSGVIGLVVVEGSTYSDKGRVLPVHLTCPAQVVT